MVQAPVEKLTLEAFLALPETKPPSEYIDGKIIQKPMPQPVHIRLQLRLAMAINQALEVGEVASAFPELRCTFGGRSIVPDIGILIWSRLPLNDQGELVNEFSGYPDWAIEVLSPRQSQTKVWDNVLHALNYGTQMGWLINPKERSILTCAVDAHPQLFTQDDQKLSVPEFAAPLELTLGTVFGWLKLGK
ncbi:Uma2 family endonuclease [cf. Phormidesmis sp. LEGE 11477]|uniref:Uma2 family endonuclease n=1 Tax=cf. Phormidesmis sp. LEGE 11477 TaxID=1828680 RepID=UPI00187EB754|nr:Uma2 family endonuclease [cf. Phormidesmis sp. LEGE 11477]MBE9064338.1 Uma2 family endonuclease [cf. Phormidesmis sp. LEGE 11477]